MFKKKIKENFSVGLFVMASILLLLISAFSFYVITAGQIARSPEQVDRSPIEALSKGRQLFLKEDNSPVDPYVTKVPNLYDLLRGPIISDQDPSLGSIDSNLSLVIFSDFECAYCAKQEKVIRDLAAKYDLRVIWKDFPYSDHSSRSYQAALAARCAEDENAFWQYHDRLFSGDYTLDREGFLKLANEIGLDTDDFADCLSSEEKAPLIDNNMREAEALGIEGVPFLYVNDQEVMGEISEGDLEKMIKVEM